MENLEKRIKSLIRDVPDFPKKGIVFKDITTFLNTPIFSEYIDFLAEKYKDVDFVIPIYLTFSKYSPLLVSILSLSPSTIWQGTVTTAPVSRVAGFLHAPLLSLLLTG